MERLNSLDAVFLDIEQPQSPMNVGSVGIFEGPVPSLEFVRSYVASGTDHIARCRQRVYEAPLHLVRPVWANDEHFDVAAHVHYLTRSTRSRTELRSIESMVEEIMETPLPRDRALWDVWMIDGLDDGRWALISKIHHCMVDGIAGTDLLSLILADHPIADQRSRGPNPRDRAPSAVAIVAHGAVASVASWRARARRVVALFVEAHRSWDHLRRVLTGARSLWVQPSHRHSPLTGKLGPRRRWLRASVSLDDVSMIRTRVGGTSNDVVLSAVSAGLRELLLSRGVAVRGRTVMAMVPVSTRSAEGHGLLDNRVAVSHALLPVGVEDPLELHAAVRLCLEASQQAHETDASTVLLHVGDFTAQWIARAVARGVVRVQRSLETVVTSVPGPQRPLYFGEHRMLEAYPYVPLAGYLQVSIGVWSYCGRLYIGVTGDRDCADDLDVLVKGIEDGLDALRIAASATG